MKDWWEKKSINDRVDQPFAFGGDVKSTRAFFSDVRYVTKNIDDKMKNARSLNE